MKNNNLYLSYVPFIMAIITFNHDKPLNVNFNFKNITSLLIIIIIIISLLSAPKYMYKECTELSLLKGRVSKISLVGLKQ